MGRVRGGMASSSVPAPLRASVLSSAAIPVVCIALCPLSPFRTHSPLPPASSAGREFSLPCGQVSWAAELRQFPVLFRSKGAIELLGKSDDL